MISSYFDGDNYIQHDPHIADGLSGLVAAEQSMEEQHIEMQYTQIHQVIGQGNFVLTVSEGLIHGEQTAFYDLFRVENGKIAEHWDVIEAILPAEKRVNSNGRCGNYTVFESRGKVERRDPGLLPKYCHAS